MLTILIFLHLVLLYDVIALCPNGYVKHDESCYKLIRTKATWAESTIYCRAMGSELANLETAVEDHFVHGWLENVAAGYNPPKFWIGGSDLVSEGNWVWAKTHKRFSETGYTNWNPGQPDNSHNENCLELTKTFHWNWNDDDCEDEKFFICEKPSSSINNGGEVIGK